MSRATEPPPAAPKPRWIVLTTHPRRERVAIEHLRSKGRDVYCPLIYRSISHARRRSVETRPLFPGYCFVAIDPHQVALGLIQATLGVRSIVRFGREPATINPMFVDGLKAREVNGVVVQPSVPYAIGDRVSIVAGAFAGTVAEVLAADEATRVKILFHMLERPVVWIAETHLIQRKD